MTTTACEIRVFSAAAGIRAGVRSGIMLLALVGLVAALPAQAATIVEHTTGNTLIKGNTNVHGQCFTTPSGGPWNNITFNFFSDPGVTPTAVGKVYIFTSEYTGTPNGLSSAGALAASTSVSNNQYVFSPSFTLLANTQYFLYSDTPVSSFPNGIELDENVNGGSEASEPAQVFQGTCGSASTVFRLSGLVVVAPPSFDTCLTDNNTGNLLQWSSTTGQYKFTRCSDGFMLTGTGTVGLVNGIKTLTDFKSDRRLSAGFNTGQLTGNATIYLQVAQGVWQTFRIVDTNPSAVCSCGP